MVNGIGCEPLIKNTIVMKTRTVSHLLYAKLWAWAVCRSAPFPTNNVQQIDPFCYCIIIKQTAGEPFEGVGSTSASWLFSGVVHFEGSLRHQDSRGNDSVISAGGIQWMNAGMGIIHSERPVNTDADLELIQLWINTPVCGTKWTSRFTFR